MDSTSTATHADASADHGHGHGDDGRTAALLAMIALLGIALSLGVVVPDRTAGSRRATPAGAAEQVVLDDGTTYTGRVERGEGVVVVHREDGSQVVLPAGRVTTVGAEDEPEATSGIVVLDDGDVFVGRVEESDGTVTVEWPAGEQLYEGQVSFPREAVRWIDPDHGRLTAEYWRRHGDAPLDPEYARPEPRRPARPARPEVDEPDPDLDFEAQLETLRGYASLAEGQGAWDEALDYWLEAFDHAAADRDFERALAAAERWAATSPPAGRAIKTAVDAIEQRLLPHRERSGVVATLATVYETAARRVLELRVAKDMADRLGGLGGEHRETAEELRAALDEADASSSGGGSHEGHGH